MDIHNKTKISFSTADDLKKSLFLTINEIDKKWTMPIHHWPILLYQFFV